MRLIRPIFLALALAIGLSTRSPAATFRLETAGVAEIQAAVDAGALSYEKLVTLYLARIAAYDQRARRSIRSSRSTRTRSTRPAPSTPSARPQAAVPRSTGFPCW